MAALSKARQVSVVADTIISVKDFGAVGDGVTNDLPAFQAAYAAAVAGNKALVLPPGTYVINDTWTISHSSVRIISLGKTIIKHTGIGNAVAIDGDASYNIFNIEFGWGSGIFIHGNANTEAALYIRAAHHLKVNVNVRDCTIGVDINFTVLSQFKISSTIYEGAFIKEPTSILRVDKCSPSRPTEFPSDNTFWVIAEGSLSYGIDLIKCTLGTFFGSSEANASGGLRVRSGSYRNTFISMDNEANGTSADWFIEGDDNAFISCIGAITTNSLIVTGDRNHFIKGFFTNTTVEATASYTKFEGTELIVLTDNSPTTSLCLAHSGGSLISQKNPSLTNQIISGNSGAATIAAGSTAYFVPSYAAGSFYTAAAVIPFDCVVRKIAFYTQAAPGVGETYTFTLVVDNVDTTLTGSINGVGNSLTLTGSVSISANSRWGIKITSSSGAASTSNISLGIKYETAIYA